MWALSFPCSICSISECPFLFGSWMSDILDMYRVKVLRDTSPRISQNWGWVVSVELQQHFECLSLQNRWGQWNLLPGELAPGLHVCFQWRTTLGRPLSWTCRSESRPSVPGQLVKPQTSATRFSGRSFLRFGWFQEQKPLCSVYL